MEHALFAAVLAAIALAFGWLGWLLGALHERERHAEEMRRLQGRRR